MVRNDGAITRYERVKEIIRTVQAALTENKESGFIPLQKTVAIISINTGLIPETVLRYLKNLDDAGMFEINEEEGKIKRYPIPVEESHI